MILTLCLKAIDAELTKFPQSDMKNSFSLGVTKILPRLIRAEHAVEFLALLHPPGSMVSRSLPVRSFV